MGLLELALLPVQHIYEGPGSSWQWLARIGGEEAPLAKLSLLCFVTAFLGMALALRWMSGGLNRALTGGTIDC